MSGAGGRTVRQHNLALLMGLICESAPVTRVELAERAGLTKVTVTNLVGELIDAGLVQDLGTTQRTGPGRPAGRVAPDPLGPVGIGLQLEVDHVAGCVVDLSGRVRRRELRRADLRRMSPAEAVRAARPVLRRLFDHATTAGQLVTGIALPVPALFGRDREGLPLVRAVPSLGWRDADLRGLLTGELDALGALGIDVRIGGPVAFAAGAECRDADVLYVGGEAEIGAVLVQDGVVRHRSAGSWGHVPVRARGRACPCGRTGCLEAYAGRAAMARAAGLAETALPRLLSGTEPFAERLAAGDRAAVRATTEVARLLADALAGPLAVLDPGAVVLGGRLAALGEPLLDPLGSRLAEQHTSPPLHVGTLGPEAALRGAASSVLADVVADPLGWSDRP
ncbi:putative NBD/HSP70 family sugar kinase [Prauserella shujinwangii]|uniref:Putative NBD/HSP70 family sugar kinase n=1 Tax=Prauserella shujinwangii TaxID=1453103 RepID=A0A2T0LQ06_9PSEU|nr:ROK family transcriptional regulator [Prauserella shujinwangii]PRX45436.1 putative NBD/HSP70 family sugar kinase [Prauserella shujinwangii]